MSLLCLYDELLWLNVYVGPQWLSLYGQKQFKHFLNMCWFPQKKDKQIWNYMRERKRQDFNLWGNCPFKMLKTKANADPPEHSLSPLAMPSVMERSGSGVLSRSRAKTVTNGNSQHSEEESSEEEHTHGTSHTFTHKHQLQTTICTFIHLHGKTVLIFIV